MATLTAPTWNDQVYSDVLRRFNVPFKKLPSINCSYLHHILFNQDTNKYIQFEKNMYWC